jgi:hypothetical protein
MLGSPGPVSVCPPPPLTWYTSDKYFRRKDSTPCTGGAKMGQLPHNTFIRSVCMHLVCFPALTTAATPEPPSHLIDHVHINLLLLCWAVQAILAGNVPAGCMAAECAGVCYYTVRNPDPKGPCKCLACQHKCSPEDGVALADAQVSILKAWAL